MSDRDSAPDPLDPDPLDRAYADAEAMLDDDAARAARRARLLGAVAEASPAAEAPRGARWPGLGRGGWAAAAGIAGLALFVAFRALPPPPAAPVQPQSPPEAANRSEPASAGRAETTVPPAAMAGDSRAHAAPPASAPPPAPSAARPTAEASTAASPTAAPPTAAARAAALPMPSAPPAARARAEADLAEDGVSEVVVTGQRRREASYDAAIAVHAPPEAKAAGVSVRLHTAAAAGRTDEVRALLETGIPIDEPDANGDTALMLSVRGGHPATAALLRRHGAGLETRNHAGESARDMAADLDDPRMDRALGLRR